MKEVGIIDMEIYLSGTILFMIMDTDEHFDHDAAMNRLAILPKQREWETVVSKFQRTSSVASTKKWRLAERIFKMDQKKEERKENGYIEEMRLS